jgi:hypothetical protein
MDAKLFGKFESFNETRTGHTKLLEIMANQAGWDESKGYCVGHFRDKQPGARCLWSCNWGTSQGLIVPERLQPLEEMEITPILVEIDDIARGDNAELGQKAANLLNELISGDFSNVNGWAASATNLLRIARERYKEYVWHFQPPIKTYQALARPGWATYSHLRAVLEGREVPIA